MDNKVKVLEAFQNASKMLDANEVVILTGLEKAEVSKHIAKLKKEGALVSPKRCFYEAVK